MYYVRTLSENKILFYFRTKKNLLYYYSTTHLKWVPSGEYGVLQDIENSHKQGNYKYKECQRPSMYPRCPQDKPISIKERLLKAF